GLNAFHTQHASAEAIHLRSPVGSTTPTTDPVVAEDGDLLLQDSYSYEEIKKKRESCHGSFLTYYREPLLLVKGKMQHVYDQAGRRYTDLWGGAATISVGHCHPEVVQAQINQISSLLHTSPSYMNSENALYAQELLENFPPGYKVYFLNSGSEATELALLLARAYTRNFDIIGLRGCYHGMTGTAMGLLGSHSWKHYFAQGFGIHRAMNPNPYRSLVKEDEAANFYANEVHEVIQTCTPGKIAGFFAESIQGVNGVTNFPPGYLKQVYEIVRQHGGVCMADEVQTGFGRLGESFWGFEAHGVVPDIMTLAKSIGNGCPLAALVAKKEIMDVLQTKLYFNTYGGNPFSCVTGRTVLKIMKRDKLQEHCANLGGYLKTHLQNLQERSAILGDVRGSGFLIGLEFVENKVTKVPAAEECLKIMEKLKDRKFLVGKGGLRGNVIRLAPPMCITKEDVDEFLNVFENILFE
ncbi:putative Alanine--glyoxylate aminotransferase 2-like protein 1, partial [Cardiosporidium cionae]